MRTPESRYYKGFTLNLCWCGYPKMRWMIHNRNGKWIVTAKTLNEAKKFINGLENE